ncbi:ester cyclase [Paraburkholderia sp. J41]|uniref:ester cyclase n=1 Tax=Paraburkholderia sp. J41 TaxID=2805433 RepID=UPI002AC31EFB|nr:ester cyclase [Paraburkholderia sp. J41]
MSDAANAAALRTIYRDYLACLNRRDWAALGQFVDDAVVHNARPFGLAGYRAMLENDVREIPDLRFQIELLSVEPPLLACRLTFDCTPRGNLFGLPINGRRVRFGENVFYRFGGASRAAKIVEVWSVIDTAAIEAQLS